MGLVSVVETNMDDLDDSKNPFQGPCWARVKQLNGWRSRVFRASVAEEAMPVWSTVFVAFHKPLFLGFNLAYIPFAPDTEGLPVDLVKFLKAVAREMSKSLPWPTFCIRFDLPFGPPEDEHVPVLGNGVYPCLESVQPEATARIDLVQGYEHAKQAYRERAIRNIRKAAAIGIRVVPWDGTTDQFDKWYAVYQETAHRDGFSARSGEYLMSILQSGTEHATNAVSSLCKHEGCAHLLLALHEDAIVGGSIIFVSQGSAVYLFGASLRLDGCSCSYLLQDHAIRMACSLGCKMYDLYGISGPGTRGSHLDGLRLFKRSFGGYSCYRPPTTDVVLQKLPWVIFRLVERIRYSLHRKTRKKRLSQQFSLGKDS